MATIFLALQSRRPSAQTGAISDTGLHGEVSRHYRHLDGG